MSRNDRLLDWAIQVMKTHADRKAILEVEFLDEEGTGLGPTLEFFALVAAELQGPESIEHFWRKFGLKNGWSFDFRFPTLRKLGK